MNKTLLILIFILVTLVGCTPKTQPAPTSDPDIAVTLTATSEKLDTLSLNFITSETCYAPCILGITPGETTVEEAWDALSSIDGLEDCFQYENGIRCDKAEVKFDDRLLANSIYFIPETLPIGLVVERYGPPDAVIVTSDGRLIDAVLFYHELGMMVVLPALPYEDSFEEYTIKPDTEVIDVGSYSRDVYEPAKYDRESVWKGFGTYPEIMNP